MVKPDQEKRMTGYTTQQRQELTEQFTRVLGRCPDSAFSRALTAAAKAINGRSSVM